MKIEGIVEFIHPTEAPSEKFTKREIGIDASVDYHGVMITNYIGVQFTQKNCALLDTFKVGDKVEIEATVGSYQMAADKKKGNRPVIYNNVTGTKIKLIQSASGAPAAAPGQQHVDALNMQTSTRPPAPEGYTYDATGTLVKLPF